ncbi:MAG: BON domain-containing protein [Knoellia sp.]
MTTTLHKTDHQLKTHVTDELRWWPNVDADHIGVAVTDGAVTLSGEVDSYPEKEAALAATFHVRGVTGVADQIIVKHRLGWHEDLDIARAAAEALKNTVVVPQGAVKVAVHLGRVTLSGSLAWNYQREAALRAVRHAPGVSFVQNDIEIKPKLPFAAEQATTKIRQALVRNAQVEADRVHVAVRGTAIELTGSVNTWHEFHEVGHAAWATPGVTSVINRLTVMS